MPGEAPVVAKIVTCAPTPFPVSSTTLTSLSEHENDYISIKRMTTTLRQAGERGKPRSHKLEQMAQAVPKLNPQRIRIGRFLPCYDRLLSDPTLGFREEWEWAKRFIARRNKAKVVNESHLISRPDLKEAAGQCAGNWTRVYILAMLWGYGASTGQPAKDGPAKLYLSLRTQDARNIIERAAGEIIQGNLEAGFTHFCIGESKLKEVGVSFGTKFLFAVGLVGNAVDVKPLVYDARIHKSLEALDYNYPAPSGLRAADYVRYCNLMSWLAKQINADAGQLEQLLFEKKGNF